jgi:TPR repeat protein
MIPQSCRAEYAPRIQFNLRLHYEKGESVPKDFGEAVKWYRKGAEQNVAPAQYSLALCYQNCSGLAKNPGNNTASPDDLSLVVQGLRRRLPLQMTSGARAHRFVKHIAVRAR